MAKATRVHSTPPTNTSALSEVAQVANGLFELEPHLLRVRDLVYAIRMLASAWDIDKEAQGALEALADTILKEINEVIKERTRLCHFAKSSDGGSHGQG
jgi:hypothetical protein